MHFAIKHTDDQYAYAQNTETHSMPTTFYSFHAQEDLFLINQANVGFIMTMNLGLSTEGKKKKITSNPKMCIKTPQA